MAWRRSNSKKNAGADVLPALARSLTLVMRMDSPPDFIQRNFGKAVDDNQFPKLIPGTNCGRLSRMDIGIRFSPRLRKQVIGHGK